MATQAHLDSGGAAAWLPMPQFSTHPELVFVPDIPQVTARRGPQARPVSRPAQVNIHDYVQSQTQGLQDIPPLPGHLVDGSGMVHSRAHITPSILTFMIPDLPEEAQEGSQQVRRSSRAKQTEKAEKKAAGPKKNAARKVTGKAAV